MRKVPLFLNGLTVLALYVLASGALNMDPASNAHGGSFLERIERPFIDLTPLGAGVLAGAAICFAVGSLAVPSSVERGSPSLSWSKLLQVAFVVNAAVVAGIAVALFLGHSYPREPQTVGVLFVTGVCEAALGAVLAVTHLFLKRPRPVFLPALGVHLLSTAALGAAYLLGSGSTP